MKTEYIMDNQISVLMIYWIGENAQDNWDIIDRADDNDIWFHLADYPSAHVILRTENITINKISKRTFTQCALQCKRNSKILQQNKSKARVIYTQIKNITKGDKLGSVYTKAKKYIYV